MNVRTAFKSILGVTECLGTGKYLGLPSMIGRSKKALFSSIKDHIWKRIQHWSGKHLSKAGREVLIKSFVQAIPAYYMSAFLIPISLEEEIQRMLNSFWWGSNSRSGRGIQWLNWEKLTVRWRLLTNPDAIFTRIFKARYFPQGYFLGARLGHNPSYVWRSIHESQAIIQEGVRWCVGSGSSIKVWTDPWLRLSSNPFISSPTISGLDHLKVKDLIDHNMGRWNTTILSALCNQRDNQVIQAIPLFHLQDSDMISWSHTRNGMYTIKSAYYQLMEHLTPNVDLRIPGNWSMLWSMKAPNTKKIFLWRVLRGCLPTRLNLQRRHVPCTMLCPTCSAGIENEWHIFFECVEAKDIWAASGFWPKISQIIADSDGIQQAIFQLLQCLSPSEALDLLCLMWGIWRKRNDILWNNKVTPSHTVIFLARQRISEWMSARETQQIPKVARNDPICWFKPPPEYMKCNVDVTIFTDSNCCGFAFYIRDDLGRFKAATTGWYNGSLPPNEAEAMACLEAITWLANSHYEKVLIELDCKKVVDDLYDSTSLFSEYGRLSYKGRSLLALHKNLEVRFVRRQANHVARTLARVSRLYASPHYFDFIPTCIATSIMNEMH
uniref:Ribonuclease H protein At1g65750 family n=1 Tax=Cajanus cajan TaxID=3821 RepID=A0A151R052_CAJCA|nr:Putative ribonuclease H protein At1g65750 family [Cajanus cajan]